MIHTLSTEKQNLTDQSHLDNFIKYLFSKSNKHQENSLTQHNAFLYRGHSETVSRFNRDASSSSRAFTKALKASGLTYSDFTMTVHYVVYAFLKNDKLYTNMFRQLENGKVEPCLDQHTFQHITDQHYNGDKERFESEIDELLDDARKVKHFDICNETVKDAITKCYIRKEFTNNTFLAITHVDQDDLYHIHTLDLKVNNDS